MPSKEEKHQELLKKIGKEADAFYRRVDDLMKEDKEFIAGVKAAWAVSNWHEAGRLHQAKMTEVVKKYYGSTHVWAIGKSHWDSKRANFYQAPFECTACKMSAAGYDEFDVYATPPSAYKIDLAAGDIPSRDMHNNLISRTCEENQAINQKHRQSRKGHRCQQCGVYDCLFDSRYL